MQQPPQQQHPSGAPLERTSSLHSNASTQQSDSTLASSRLATLGSSMPRSEPGSLADAAELLQQRQQLEAVGQVPPQAHLPPSVLSPRSAAQQQQQPGPMQPGYPLQQQPTRILKREPQPNGVAHGHPQPGTAVNLPSQASLMDHLSSPSQQHAMGMPASGLPRQQGPQAAGMEAIARGLLPPQHAALAPGMPMPGVGAAHLHPHLPPQQRAPVSVVANFGGQAPSAQQQHLLPPGSAQQPALGVPSAAMHPGLLGHPQLAALEQQRQQQHAAAPLVPTSLPLMTFGPPQQVPGAHAQYAAAPLAAPGSMLAPPHVQQQPHAMMQFGAIQLPSAIDGSVDAEAPPSAAEQSAPMPAAAADVPLSAEAQRAYMKQKAAERARQLQQQQQQQQGVSACLDLHALFLRLACILCGVAQAVPLSQPAVRNDLTGLLRIAKFVLFAFTCLPLPLLSRVLRPDAGRMPTSVAQGLCPWWWLPRRPRPLVARQPSQRRRRPAGSGQAAVAAAAARRPLRRQLPRRQRPW